MDVSRGKLSLELRKDGEGNEDSKAIHGRGTSGGGSVGGRLPVMDWTFRAPVIQYQHPAVALQQHSRLL